jgi:hypothetical protein
MDPNDVVVEPGLQELEGRAHAVEEPVTAPYSGGDGSNWKTVESGVDTVPFEIEGGGETVAADPANANYLLTDEFRVRGRELDDFPPGVLEYAEENEGVGAGAAVELGPINLGGQRRRRGQETAAQECGGEPPVRSAVPRGWYRSARSRITNDRAV